MRNFLLLAVALMCVVLASSEQVKPLEGKTVGIDLGTTYSCVGSYLKGKGVQIIVNSLGKRITPSYVAFTENERLIGEAAKNQASANPTNTLYDVKRFIGRKFSDPTVQRDIKLMPFKIIQKDDKPYIQVLVNGEKKTFAPEEISAMVLQRMKQISETFLGGKVANAVITVPAYFDDGQRKATVAAGRIAGLNVLRIINEPTAAAIAYGLDKKGGSESNVLVFDLGGGTFDVSLLKISGDGVFEVAATNGDTHLGGEDFDQRIVSHMIKVYQKKTGEDPSGDKRAFQKLRRHAEQAKKALSSQVKVNIEIDSFFKGKDFKWSLSRARFEELNSDLFVRTLEPVKNVLKDAKMQKKDINDIVLVGGSTRIPKVQELLKAFFDGKTPSRGINPDEAVAYGAAVQAGNLAGESSQAVVLIDVIPLSLGIETVGGVMNVIIDRNSNVPIRKTQIFTTSEDNQEAVIFPVFEGERTMTKDNNELGKFELSGILPGPSGHPQLQVTFEVDVNSILHVSAKDLATGKREQISITRNDDRSEDEVKRMIKEAEKFAESDKKNKEKVEAKNKLEQLAYSAKNALSSAKDLEARTKKKLKVVISEVIDWLEDKAEKASLDTFQFKLATLQKATKTLFEDQGKDEKDDL